MKRNTSTVIVGIGIVLLPFAAAGQPEVVMTATSSPTATEPGNSTLQPDTLELFNRLERDGGFESKEAAAIVRSLVDVVRNVATRNDVHMLRQDATSRMTQLQSRMEAQAADRNATLTRWLALTVFGAAGATIGGVGLISSYHFRIQRMMIEDVRQAMNDLKREVHAIVDKNT